MTFEEAAAALNTALESGLAQDSERAQAIYAEALAEAAEGDDDEAAQVPEILQDGDEGDEGDGEVDGHLVDGSVTEGDGPTSEDEVSGTS